MTQTTIPPLTSFVRRPHEQPQEIQDNPHRPRDYVLDKLRDFVRTAWGCNHYTNRHAQTSNRTPWRCNHDTNRHATTGNRTPRRGHDHPHRHASSSKLGRDFSLPPQKTPAVQFSPRCRSFSFINFFLFCFRIWYSQFTKRTHWLFDRSYTCSFSFSHSSPQQSLAFSGLG